MRVSNVKLVLAINGACYPNPYHFFPGDDENSAFYYSGYTLDFDYQKDVGDPDLGSVGITNTVDLGGTTWNEPFAATPQIVVTASHVSISVSDVITTEPFFVLVFAPYFTDDIAAIGGTGQGVLDGASQVFSFRLTLTDATLAQTLFDGPIPDTTFTLYPSTGTASSAGDLGLSGNGG